MRTIIVLAVIAIVAIVLGLVQFTRYFGEDVPRYGQE